MSRTAPLPAYYQSARLWAPRFTFCGVQWRVAMRGRVLPWEKRQEFRFLARLGFALGVLPAIVLFLTHLL